MIKRRDEDLKTPYKITCEEGWRHERDIRISVLPLAEIVSEKLRILIVDDNEMMVKTLQDILRLKGYQTEPAYSGLEALRKVEDGAFDFVLSDIKMPDLNGVDLYRAIKVQ